MGLNSNYIVQQLWHKMQIFPFLYISVFSRFCTKTHIRVFCVFGCFIITFVPIKIQTWQTPQIDCLNLSFVKDTNVAGKKRPDMVLKWSFISYYFLRVHRTRTQPQGTSEAITFEPIKIQAHEAFQNDCWYLSFVKDEGTQGKKMAKKQSYNSHL